MDFVLFSIFSSMEVTAMFAIMFALFRFEYPFYHVNVLFIAVMMSFVSFSLRYGLNLSNFSTVIQFLLLIFFFALMYRQHLFYAAITVTISFVIYGLLQLCVLSLLDYLSVISMAEVQKEFTPEVMALQFICSLCAMGIYYLIKRYNKGFSFIPHTNRLSIQWTGINLIIIILIVIATGVIGVVYYYFNINHYSLHLLLSCVLLFLLGYLLYLSRKKDEAL